MFKIFLMRPQYENIKNQECEEIDFDGYPKYSFW